MIEVSRTQAVRWAPPILPAMIRSFSLDSSEFLAGADVVDTFYSLRALVGDSLASGTCTIGTDSPGGGYVVFNESCFPGWRASIDGAPAPILRANHLFQTVRVPADRHEVRFEYSSRFLGFGMALSGLSLLALVGWMLRRRRV